MFKPKEKPVIRSDVLSKRGSLHYILMEIGTYVVPAIFDGLNNLRNNEKDDENLREIWKLENYLKCSLLMNLILGVIIAALVYQLHFRSF